MNIGKKKERKKIMSKGFEDWVVEDLKEFRREIEEIKMLLKEQKDQPKAEVKMWGEE